MNRHACAVVLGMVLAAPAAAAVDLGVVMPYPDMSNWHYATVLAADAGGHVFVCDGATLARLDWGTKSWVPVYEDVMLSWIEYYGAHLVHRERLLSREMGDLMKRPDELRKAKQAGRQLVAHVLGRG